VRNSTIDKQYNIFREGNFDKSENILDNCLFILQKRKRIPNILNIADDYIIGFKVNYLINEYLFHEQGKDVMLHILLYNTS
jgi:hypothetical protein